METPKTMRILGLSCFYHDSAACILKDGQLIAAAQEERFTRIKHDAAYPEKSIAYCLKEAGLSGKDLDLVVFYDKPFLKFERILETYLAYSPKGLRSFLEAIPVWIKQKLWIKETLREKLDYQGTVLFPEHHESHTASAFYPSPFQEAAILTMDGVGEWATTSYGIGRGNKIEILGDIRFPHSLGLLYSAFTYYTGFKVNSGEYKVMGLAPYGKPVYKDLILKELIDLKEDGSFKMNMKYFDYCAGLRMTNGRFDKLFGGPRRKPESRVTQREMDLARSVQEVTEEAMVRMANHIRKKTGMKNLCLSGGVALNCVGNGKVLRECGYDDIWIQPAAGDAGSAVGAAFFAWHQYLEKPRTVPERGDAMKGAYLGPAFSESEIESFLTANDIPYRKLSDEEIPETVADLIAQEKVIGWFSGRMEFGPRALGGRSIIGDARSSKMQETMNLKIKFRESFRPFAPTVLEEKVSQYFDFSHKSPYMLMVAPVAQNIRLEMSDEDKKKEGIELLNVSRSSIPAVTHVDYSARIQTVNPVDHTLYYQTVKKFDEKYGCPVIINTSFNVRGEPIVCTPEDAWRCFMRTHMDYLIVGNYLLDKKEQKALEQDTDWQKEFELD